MEKNKLLIVLFLLLAASGQNKAFGAETVTINSKWPIPYAGYQTAKVDNNLTVGTGDSATATTAIAGYAQINGDITDNGPLTIANSLFIADPDYGPYGHDAVNHVTYRSGSDGLKIVPATAITPGAVLIGSASSFLADTSLKVSTAFSGGDMYALDYNAVTPIKKYGVAKGFTDAAGKKAWAYAKFDNGTMYDFTDDGTQFAPLRIDGYYVLLMEKTEDFIGPDHFLGAQNYVLIGTQTPVVLTDPTHSLFLQVGDPTDGGTAAAVGGGIQSFSSRTLKKDIMTFTVLQYDHALAEISKTSVWHYQYKKDQGQKLRMGLIAENAPLEMVTENKIGLNLSDSLGYLAAAMKGLIIKHDELKKRLDALEKTKSKLEAGLKK